ncbi:MAG: helix-turn-helix domain-containing protein [Pirellulaceae bacterium]
MESVLSEGIPAVLHRLLELQREVLARIDQLVGPAVQSWYSPAEVARIIGRKPATVRGWCRTGRLAARKRSFGRGGKLDWEIASEELQRYRDHGLLPKETRDA